MATDIINLDHHATTAVPPAVWDAMRAAPPGNSSSGHSLGRVARRAFDEAKERVAARLGAHPDEVLFTSGATESNNIAIFGAPPGPVAAGPIEHSCVTEPLKSLARRGEPVTWLPVAADGTTIVSDLTDDLKLVAVMLVNHETGAIQPVVPAGPWRWHCDAAQAVGKLPVNFQEMGATTLSASGHKFGAPPGIGILLIRRGVTLRPLTFGGPHQQGRRPGTEPVAFAVGLATALDLSCDAMEHRRPHVASLKARLIENLAACAGTVVVNSPERSSPYVVNVSFPGLRADQLLMAFDTAGVACSAGPACSSGTVQVSAGLQAMGMPEERLRSAIRFSFSAAQTRAEIDEAGRRIERAVRHLRR
ncbi:MAG: cysteine desulfurase [Gemmataceae bacterium]|nr:cysteine desulfurase [Gemmataceae bacterium]